MRNAPVDMVAGTIHQTTNYGDLAVVKYNSKKMVEVEFIATKYKCLTEAAQIRRGGVKDKMVPTVFGVGFIGGDNYSPKVKGVVTKAYTVWQAMIRRCYSEICLKKQPTYSGCTVSTDWHNFQTFAEWFYDNYPDDGKCYELDKDIKIDGNREYSSNSCIFVSKKENTIKSSGVAISLTSADGVTRKYKTCSEAALSIGVSPSSLSKLLNGKVKTAKGWFLTV